MIVNKVSMMYKVMNNLVDNGSAPATLQPSNRTTGGQQPNLQVTYSRTNMHHNSFFPSVTLMWSSVPPEAQTAASLDAFKCKLGGWAESVSKADHKKICHF